MLILPIWEHKRSFHFLITSSVSLFKDLQLLLNRSFTCLVSVTPRYFMLFVAIVKSDVSLISLSAYLWFVYRRATGLFFCFFFFLSCSCILPHHTRYLSAEGVLWYSVWGILGTPSYHLQIMKVWLLPFQFKFLWSPFVV